MRITIITIAIAMFLAPLNALGVGYASRYDEDYQIRFGWMKQRPDGSYYVYKETRTIPLLPKDSGFRWGYTIHSKSLTFDTRSIDYGPAPLHDGTDDTKNSAEEQVLAQVPTTAVYDGVYWRWSANSEDDPLGAQRIEVFINGKLHKTIYFNVIKP